MFNNDFDMEDEAMMDDSTTEEAHIMKKLDWQLIRLIGKSDNANRWYPNPGACWCALADTGCWMPGGRT